MAPSWPGNVRELRNVIERAVILEATQEIQPASLPDFHLEGRLRKTEIIPVTGAHSLDELMADFERQPGFARSPRTRESDDSWVEVTWRGSRRA